jgi:riboflavin kinase / FMN adenylyltransferase
LLGLDLNCNMSVLYRSPPPFPETIRGGVIAVGNFDGVHQGHQCLIERLCSLANAVDGPSIVFTFDPSPAELLYPGHVPPALTWMERRATLLHRLGVEIVIAFPTTKELLELTAAQFFEMVLIEQLGVRGLVEGPNFRFGKGRDGDVRFLQRKCHERKIPLEIVQPQNVDGVLISSSRIRSDIMRGDIEAANRFLLEPYRIIGRVSQGAQRGRQLGFPTANLEAIPVLVPPPGVYAGRAYVGDTIHKAAIHIGPNPTFEESQPKVEVHILDFAGDLYGSNLEVEMLARLRGVQKFESVDALLCQLRTDIASARLVGEP